MANGLVLLGQAEGFRARAALEAGVVVHPHLQQHHRHLVAAAGVMAGPKHTIRMVGGGRRAPAIQCHPLAPPGSGLAPAPLCPAGGAA
ncbi:MAG: hypothetical protein ACK6BG_01935 [Cyanobacteriota bacterium]